MKTAVTLVVLKGPLRKPVVDHLRSRFRDCLTTTLRLAGTLHRSRQFVYLCERLAVKSASEPDRMTEGGGFTAV